MQRFCLKLAGFLLLQLAVFSLLASRSTRTPDDNYLAATIDKHARLQQAKAPRVILVGGSNLAFGVDSLRLEEQLNRPVVNMGLVAGLGLEFMLNEVADSIQHGDVVVLSLEYDRFSGGYNPLNLQQILEIRPASLFYLEPYQMRKVLLAGGLSVIGGVTRHAFPWEFDNASTSGKESPYVRRGFNDWGDLTAHHGKSGQLLESSGWGGDSLRSDWLPTPFVRSRLEAFAKHCAARGSHFVYSNPPHPAELFVQRSDSIQSILAVLNQIPHLTVIDTPADHHYDLPLFYDTGYHLTRRGAELRTERLIQALKPFMASRSENQNRDLPTARQDIGASR